MQTSIADENAIDPSQIGLVGLAEKPFPASAPFRVVISTAAHDTMWRHAAGTLQDGDQIKEVGGILVGELYRDDNGAYLEVTAAIVAEHTRNEGTEVAFTPETWAQVNRVKDQMYPDHRMVGWYHTHPNFGIFLSDRDRFVHRHSFPQPWGLAYVIDPVQRAEGLFVWRAGDVKEAPEYWVGTERRAASAASTTVPVAKVEAALPGEPRVSWVLPLGLTLIVVLATGVVAYTRELQRAERDALIVRVLESERVEIDRAFQVLQTLRAEVERVSKQSASDIERLRGQVVQLDGGLRNLNGLARGLQRRVQGLEAEQSASIGEQK